MTDPTLRRDGYWRWRTDRGQVSIVPDGGSRFNLMFNKEPIGSYHSALSAHSDAIQGVHFSTSTGVRTSELGVPKNLLDWEFQRWDPR